MKLTSAQVERTLGQFEARTIPDNHPMIPQLNDLFGEHTFFLDRNGLNILEPAEADGAAAQSAQVVNLASWSDDNPTGLEQSLPARIRTEERCMIAGDLELHADPIQ
jgi:hypothetical protein